MIPVSAHTKVFLAQGATDMRKSFHGLITLPQAVLRKDPTSGHLFVFLNRRRDMIRMLRLSSLT
jgi:transposase